MGKGFYETGGTARAVKNLQGLHRNFLVGARTVALFKEGGRGGALSNL